MANFNVVLDEDQQWLLSCLSATLDPSHEVRSFAEASLNQASLQPGPAPNTLSFAFDFLLFNCLGLEFELKLIPLAIASHSLHLCRFMNLN